MTKHGTIPNEGFIQLEPDFKLWHKYANSKSSEKLPMTGKVLSTENESAILRLEIETIVPPSRHVSTAKTTSVITTEDKNEIIRASLEAQDFMFNKALLSDYWALIGRIVSKSKTTRVLILYFGKIEKACYAIMKEEPVPINPRMN